MLPKSVSLDEMKGTDQPSSQAASLSDWFVHFLYSYKPSFDCQI